MPSSRASHRARPGFTLVELLVVVAIIVVLVGMLLPAVMSARNAAQSAQCQNNLKQLGLACLQYRDTYGMYPQYRAEYPAITNNYGVVRPRWQWIMASYMGGWAQSPEVLASLQASGYADTTYTYIPMDNKSFVCPSMESTSTMVAGISGGTADFRTTGNNVSIRNGSYGYNFGYLGNCRTLIDGDTTTATLNYPVYTVKEPTRTIAFGDSRGGMVGGGGHSMTLDPPHMVKRRDSQSVTSPYWQQAPFSIASGVGPAGYNPYGPDEGTPDITVPFSPAMARHNGRANVVFLDGHTASMTLQELGYALDATGTPTLQTKFAGTVADLPVDVSGKAANNSLWTGRGLDEYDTYYNTDAP
jgi:prepilin-type processing-associated H-X9-DG protein/prepilin-type N-terminal cleavage/methylation domain-containing protein